MPSAPGAGTRVMDLPHRQKMEILLGIMIGLFLGALDQTIVGVALPTVVGELQGGELYTWVVTIYLLTSTISGPFYGKLSDLYGRKPLLLAGILIFLAGSALSALSQDIFQLILFRGIQGFGAGALFPVALATIGDLFTPAERGKYQGLFGAVFGVASILGPLLGGFLTENVSWHWIFLVNLPIGIVSVFLIARLLPTIKHESANRDLDYLGAAIFTAAVSALLIGLTNAQSADWTAPQVGGLIAAGVVGFLVFLAVEARVKEPIVPPQLFRNRTYAASIAATFFTAFGFFSLIIWLPLWFQFVKGATPTNSGLYTLALLVGLIVSSIGSGQLVARTGRYKAIIVGSILVMMASLYLFTNLRSDTSVELTWLWMFIGGLGIGPTLAVFTIVIQNAVPVDKLGVATSNLTFFRQVGGSIALAVTGTLLAQRVTEELPGQLEAAGVPARFTSQLGSTGFDVTGSVGVDLGATILANVPDAAKAFVEPLIPNIVAGIHQAFSIGVASTFWWGLGATAIGLVFALIMPELPLRHHATEPSEADATAGADDRPAELAG